MNDVDEQIAQANIQLKNGRIGMNIQRRGSRLCLQATLPPKPGASKGEHQQRIALNVRATQEGVKLAEKEARKIRDTLDSKQFSWEPYLRVKLGASKNGISVARWIEKFEQHYFSIRRRTPESESTWEKSYLALFKKIPGNNLNAEALEKAVLSTEPDTKTRQATCLALSKLAEFAEIPVKLSQFKGKYSPARVNPRDLPTDEEIAQWRDQIPNKEWQWVYGILATYGLRPHEIFHLDTSRLATRQAVLKVTAGKTGSRPVWPCYLEWVEAWDLANVLIPKVTGRNNSELGSRVTGYFRKAKIPFCPYNLRHSWARRTLEFGLDVNLAAQQMGHSVKIHTNIYHAWIGEEPHKKAFELLTLRPDRPRPPHLNLL